MQDLKQATNTARKMVEEYGMSDAVGPMFLGGDTEVFIAKDWGHAKNYSEQLSAKIDAEIRSILEEQFSRAERILTEHREGLDACAALLLKYERVTGEEFVAVYQGEDMDTVMQKSAQEQEEADKPDATEPKPEENSEGTAEQQHE